MKNFFLKTGLTLLCLIIGLGSAWGDTVTTYTFSSKSWDASPANWTSGKAGNGFTANQGVQITSGTTGANATSPKSFSNVSKIVVQYCTNAKAGKGTVTLKVGSTEFGSQAITAPSSGGTALRTFELNNSNNLSGSVNINVECGTNSIYIYSIEITEASGTTDDRTPVNITGFSAKSSTLIKGNTTTTTVTNDQTGWTPSYTYSSNKESVATVAADGTITAVGKGTATITAALNIANDDANYKVGTTFSKTLEITVKNPSHTATFIANGQTFKDAQTVEEDEAIEFPSSKPSDESGKVFVGWMEGSIEGTTNEAPDFVTSATMGTSDVTYYAVYAKKEGSTKEYSFSILPSHFNGTSYNANNGSHTVTATATSGSETMDVTFVSNQAMLSSQKIQFQKSNGYIYNETDLGTIKSVTINNGANLNTFYGTSSHPTSGTTCGGGYFTIKATTAAVGTSSSINVTFEIGSVSYSGYCTTVDTSTPSISANDVNIAADATSGEIEYSITNAVTGKGLSANTTAEWISNIQVTADKVTFTTTANTATTERTAEITLTYDGATDKVVTVTQAGKQGDPEITNFIKTSTLELVVGAPDYDIRNCLNIPNDYDTSTYSITTTINGLTQKDGEYACVYPYIAFSKAGEYTVHVVAAAMPGKYAQTEGDITVTVTDPAPAITTIPALFTKATEVGGTDTDINLTLNNWVVSGVNGKNAYVTDGTNGFIIYQDSHGFTAGNVLNGTVACKVLLYNGAAEIKGLTSSTTGLTVTTGGTITPRTTTIGALENINVGSVITLENVSFDDPNLTDGENTIQPFTSLYSYPNTTFTQGTHYNVTGVYILYKSGSNIIKEILPRSAEDIEEVQAEKYAINIAPCENGTVTASLEEAAAGVEVTLTVTPNSGYQLSTLAVTNATTSEAITVTSNTFIMPAAAVNVAATFEEATPSDIIFYESFDDNDGTGGNDDKWSGSIASNTLSTKETSKSDWTFVKGNGADQCAKFGTGSAKGSATTPALNYTGNATLTFKAGAWNSTSEGTTLNISIEGGGSASPTSVTLTKGAWGEYTINLTGLTTTSKIKFEAANASNNRFFLDEVTVTKSSITPATEYDIIIASDIEHGTISASKAKAEEGDNITITATPATGYQLATLYYTIDGDETQNTIENLTFTMPANNVTIHATFMETITGTFTINYSVNGIIRKTETLEANASLNFPAVSSMYGKVFLGWTTSEVPDEVDVQPETVGAIKATTDATYYALFATKNSTAGSDELTKVDELVAGMDVILAMEEAGTPSKGISGVDNEHSTAIVSTDPSEWVKFTVNVIGETTCLAYGTQYVTPSDKKENKFKLTDDNGTNFYINNHQLGYTTDYDYILAENHSTSAGKDEYFYRFYKTSTVSGNTNPNQVYTPFFVYTDGSSTTYSAYTTLPSYVKLDESTTNGTYENVTFGTVKIIRSMKADDTWNSLCLPFSMNEEQIATAFGEGTDVRELTTASVTGTAPDEVLHLNFTQVTAIEAGKLYMVRVPAAITEFYVEDTEVNTAEPAQDYSKGDYTIQTHSNYNYMDGTTNGYVPVGSFVISGNKFMQVGSSTQKMKAFRGYITATDASGNPVKALGIGFIDPLTGINNVEFNTDARIYNLQGLQQSKFQKGINIVNGKKVIR